MPRLLSRAVTTHSVALSGPLCFTFPFSVAKVLSERVTESPTATGCLPPHSSRRQLELDFKSLSSGKEVLYSKCLYCLKSFTRGIFIIFFSHYGLHHVIFSQASAW